MKQKLLSFLAVCLFLVGIAHAQTRQVTGRVTSASDGTPISGVSVSVAGTSTATQTDGGGNYSISASTDATLVFSYVGFATQRVTAGNQSVINTQLVPSDESIEEVVVTGVGVATARKKIAFAVESVSASELPQAPQGSIDQALVGKIAGAQISSTSGQPGQQAAILLRGINTLNSTQPMILVDGVQINANSNDIGSDFTDPESRQNVSSRLSDLDLSNVERIEVVQGSAAATIYGAQGANGVIQIFTKRGSRNQRPRITVNSRASVDNVLRGNLAVAQNHYFPVDADGFILDANGNRIARDDNGRWSIPELSYDGTTLNNKPYREQTFDQLSQLFQSNALTHNTNINIAGGGESSDYSLTMSHLNQESVIFGKNKRTNLNANIGIEPFKNFTFRSISQFVYGDNTAGIITGENNIYSPVGSAVLSRRYWDLTFQNADGHYVSDPENSNSVNPFYTLQFNPRTAITSRVVQNFNLNYKFERFLELDYKYGIDNTRFDYQDFVRYQGDVKTPGAGIPSLTGSISQRNSSETLQNSLLSAFFRTNFTDDFGSDLPIETTTHLAFDWRKESFNQIRSNSSGFAAFPPYNLSAGDEQSVSQLQREFVTYGYLVNQRIDYGSLFGVSGGVRIDYASTFGGEDFKPFVFPRADAYFNIADILESNTLSLFKIRGAYGAAGTQPGAYDRQLTLNRGNIGSAGYLSLRNTANNIDLEVEVSKETEFGIDMGLNLSNNDWFKRLNLSATYWVNNSKSVIRALDLPPSSGVTGIRNNAIDLSSRGLQLSLDLDLVQKENFSWAFGTRVGASRSMVDRISNGKDIILGSSGEGQFVLREGEEVSTFFGYRPLTSVDQLDANGERYIPSSDVGDYELVNGMIVNKTSKAVRFTSENLEIGNPTPLFTATFLNNFVINRNLTIGMQLDWYYGNDIYNQTKQWMYRDLVHSDLDQSITVDGQSGAYVNYYNSLYNTNNANLHFVEDGSFLRLRDLTIGYNITSLLGSSVTNTIKDLHLALSGRNLLTITNYSGIDPEASAAFNHPTRRGIDLHSFPNVRSVQLALRVGF